MLDRPLAPDVDEFRPIADTLPQIVWAVAADGSIAWVNAAFAAFTGCSLDRDPVALWMEVLHPDECSAIFQEWGAAFENRRAFEFEYRLRAKDGSYGWFLGRTTPVFDEGGTLRRWYGISTNVDAIKQNDERLRAILDSFREMVWFADSDGIISRVNDQFSSYSGLDAEALADRGWSQIVHPDDVATTLVSGLLSNESAEVTTLTLRLRRYDEEYRYHVCRFAPVRERDGTIGTWIVTALDAHDEVRRRTQLQLLADTIPQFVYVTARDGTVQYANEQVRAYCDLDLTDPAFRWNDVVHPDDLEIARAFWQRIETEPIAPEIELRMRRSDGVYRWFLSRFSAHREADGTIAKWYTTATDIHDRKRAADGLAYLVEANDVLGSARDVEETLRIAAELAVPRVADWCAIYLREATGFFKPAAIHHWDPALVELARETVRYYPFSVETSAEMIRSRQPNFLPDIPPDVLRDGAVDARHADMLARLDIASAIVVPLVIDDEVIGMVHLVRGRLNDRFTKSDVDFAQVLAKRIAGTVDNAMTFERERNVAKTFQDAALPRRLPTVRGIDLHAVYVAGLREAEIGGDWYDALTLADGSLVFSIGDVSGKGLEAAVLMASIRQAIRVAALQGLAPKDILRVADAALGAEQPGRFVTAFVGSIAPDRQTLTYASAGHPLPLLRDGAGTHVLEPGGTPLGFFAHPFEDHRRELRAPWLLVAFTDGLIERTRDAIEGERAVLAAVESDGILHAFDPAAYVLGRASGTVTRDDTAVLTLRADVGDHWRFGADDAMRADSTRRSFSAWLGERSDCDLAAAELIFGELVGNVVRHAPGTIDIDVTASEDGVEFFVQDGGDSVAMNGSLPNEINSEGGRGLFLIGQFARAAESLPLPVFGKQIRVKLASDRPHTDPPQTLVSK